MSTNGITEPKRPYRIWDAHKKVHLQGRNYVHKQNAHNAALIYVRWSRVGETLEVYDIRTGRLLGQYTRRLHTIAFQRG